MGTTDERAPGEAQAAGVYVHLPFCARICPYCDFAVTIAREGEPSRLVEALLGEIGRRAPGFRHPVDTLYFGGGTPSLMAPDDLRRLIDSIRRELRVADRLRIFLEANPEDVAPEAVEAWRALGVTTVSLGIQSLDPEALRFLGRRHTPAEARRSIELCRDAGFETVSVDQIYALPGQTVEEWLRELDSVIATEPDHLSCYQLTVEPSTPFGRRAASGRLVELGQSLQADLLVATHERLAELGWEPYEVSNFARSPEHRSRHNLKYWNGAAYLGLGPSAHSFDPPERRWNVADSREYVRRAEDAESVEEGSERLTAEQRLLEVLMLGLRTTAGIDLAEIEERFDRSLLGPNRDLLEGWVQSGWARMERTRILPTPRGLAIADRLAASLELPDS